MGTWPAALGSSAVDYSGTADVPSALRKRGDGHPSSFILHPSSPLPEGEVVRHRQSSRVRNFQSRSILAQRDIFVKRAALRHDHGRFLHEKLCSRGAAGVAASADDRRHGAQRLGRGRALGGNIGAVYPFIKVVFEGKSLQQWVDGELAKTRQTAAELTGRLETLDKERAAAGPQRRPKLESDIATTQSRLKAERRAERTYVWLKPYLDRYLPNDPFRTVALIAAALLLGTVLKDLFAIANSVLAARLAQLATFGLRKRFYRRTLRLDLATFNDEGTSDLMSRFTNDMQNVASGVESLFGRLICEPLKMVSCLVVAAWISWRLLVLSLVIAPLAGLAIRWLAKTLKRANRRGDGRNGPNLQYPRGDLPRDQDRQGLHQRIAGTQAVSRPQQGLLQEGDEDRQLRQPLPSADRVAGHPDALPGLAGRGLAGADRLDHAAGHPHVRPRDGPRLAAGVLRVVGRRGRSNAEVLRDFQPPAIRHGGQRPHLPAAGPPAGRLQPGGPGSLPSPPSRPGLRPGRLRLPARSVGAGRRLPADSFWRGHRHCRSQRLRQEHAGQPGAAFRRSDPRRDPAGRRAAGRHAIARPSRPDRHRHAGNRALRRHGVQQHPLRSSAGDDGGSDRGRPAAPMPIASSNTTCPTATRP